MKLHEFKKKLDAVFRYMKKHNLHKIIDVTIQTNDMVFTGEKLFNTEVVNDVGVSIKKESHQVVVSCDKKLYSDIHKSSLQFIDNSRKKYCITDCGNKNCECKMTTHKNKIFGVLVNGTLTLPLYYGDNNGLIGLKIVVDRYNEGVNEKNDILNYDKYLDFQAVNDKKFVGGLDNNEVIELVELPCHDIPQKINLF